MNTRTLPRALMRAAVVLGLAGLVACGAEPQVRSIAITPATATVEVSKRQAFQAEATFEDGTRRDVTQDADWMTSDTQLAFVSNTGAERGVLTARKAGSVTVTATFGGVKGTSAVAIPEVTLAALKVETEAGSIPKGVITQLTATGVYTDGSERDLTAQAAWTVADAAIAQVVEAHTGKVKGLDVGTTRVTATIAGRSAEATLTVTAATLQALKVEAHSIAKGTTAAFTLTGTYSDGSEADLTAQATWAVADEAVAVLVEEAPGHVKGLGVGSTRVTATFEARSANATLTVTAAEFVELLPLQPERTAVQAATEVQLTVMALFTDGSTQDFTEEAEWTVTAQTPTQPAPEGEQQEPVLTVSAGKVTGGVPGTATVAASFEGKTVSLDLTVHRLSVYSPEIFNFHTLGAGLRKQVTLQAGVTGPVDTQMLYRWKVSVKNAQGAPVAGVKFFFPANATEAAAAHTEWTQELETDAQGDTWWGPATGFTLDDAGLLSAQGSLSTFSALVPEAGEYFLGLSLVEVEGEARIAGVEFPVRVAEAAVAIEGMGFLNPVPAETRTPVTVTAQVPASFDATRMLRWRLRVTTLFNDAVAGVKAYYPTESDGEDHTMWTSFIETDAQGTTWFGPETGFTATQAGLNTATGTATHFSVWVPVPSSVLLYNVEVALVDLADASVVAATTSFAAVTVTPAAE